MCFPVMILTRRSQDKFLLDGKLDSVLYVREQCDYVSQILQSDVPPVSGSTTDLHGVPRDSNTSHVTVLR